MVTQQNHFDKCGIQLSIYCIQIGARQAAAGTRDPPV